MLPQRLDYRGKIYVSTGKPSRNNRLDVKRKAFGSQIIVWGEEWYTKATDVPKNGEGKRVKRRVSGGGCEVTLICFLCSAFQSRNHKENASDRGVIGEREREVVSLLSPDKLLRVCYEC